MFELQDLSHFSLEIDLSKHLPEKEDEVIKMLEKIDLNMLNIKFFTGIDIGLRDLAGFLPTLVYRKSVGDAGVDILIFRDRKIRLMIRKAEKTITMTTVTPKEEEENLLTSDSLNSIGTDFNFILGKMLGIVGIRENPSMEADFSLEKNGIILPSRKLRILKESVSTLLANPETDIAGLRIHYTDDSNIKHSFELTQLKEKIRVSDTFEFTPSGPIVLPNLLASDLKLINEICSKMCEE